MATVVHGKRGGGLGALAMVPVRFVMGVIDAPLRGLQRVAGLNGMAAFFLLPNMLIFSVFVLLPLVINFAYSMTGGTAIFLSSRNFVGGDQYARLFDCRTSSTPTPAPRTPSGPRWATPAGSWSLQVALMIGAALVTALILNREIRARGFWRAVFFFPVLLSPVVVGLIWRWILQRQGSAELRAGPVRPRPYAWLTEPAWSFAAAVGVSVWAHMGFYTLILLAGLQAIPKDLYEAAEMDGTRPARAFWRITLPLLMPNLLVVLVLALIRAVQIFDEVYVLTGGGPGTEHAVYDAVHLRDRLRLATAQLRASPPPPRS